MKKLALAAIALMSVWSVSSNAALLISSTLFDEDYSPSELGSLIVNGNSNSVGGAGAFLQLNPAGTREIAIQDSIAAAGSLGPYDQVRFDFSIDYLGQGEQFGNFGTNDKDLFVGIHDGSHHFSVFTNETAALAVFGDSTSLVPSGQLGVGFVCNPTSATCLRQTNVDPSYNASGFNASILLDDSGIGRLTVNGFESELMDLNTANEMFFFIGRDGPTESYRIQSASVSVTGIIVNVPEPDVLAAVLAGGLMTLWASRRRRPRA